MPRLPRISHHGRLVRASVLAIGRLQELGNALEGTPEQGVAVETLELLTRALHGQSIGHEYAVIGMREGEPVVVDQSEYVTVTMEGNADAAGTA